MTTKYLILLLALMGITATAFGESSGLSEVVHEKDLIQYISQDFEAKSSDTIIASHNERENEIYVLEDNNGNRE